MAICTRIKSGFAWRMIIIAAVCTVLGLWGVYDYAVAIPRRAEALGRLELYGLVKDALEARAALASKTQAAREAVEQELERIIGAELTGVGDLTNLSPEEARQRVGSQIPQALASMQNEPWVGELILFLQALGTSRPPGELGGAHREAWEAAAAGVNRLGSVEAPGKYDRVTQWAFIACLPFSPYLLWAFLRTRRQVYRLEDDGTLDLPKGTWKAQEIADIDMVRWMSKSIAWVVHRDGTRVKLDDYKHRDMHLIVGALASRLHPDQWDDQARPRNRGGSQATSPAAADPAGPGPVRPPAEPGPPGEPA